MFINFTIDENYDLIPSADVNIDDIRSAINNGKMVVVKVLVISDNTQYYLPLNAVIDAGMFWATYVNGKNYIVTYSTERNEWYQTGWDGGAEA